jgi:hypothetical protein
VNCRLTPNPKPFFPRKYYFPTFLVAILEPCLGSAFDSKIGFGFKANCSSKKSNLILILFQVIETEIDDSNGPNSVNSQHWYIHVDG